MLGVEVTGRKGKPPARASGSSKRRGGRAADTDEPGLAAVAPQPDAELVQEQILRRERLAVMGEMAGSIAHELRNPLGAIRNATYFLNMVLGSELNAQVGKHLRIINEQIERSDRIITALLDYARGRPCNPAPASIAEVIDDALEMAHLPPSVKVLRSSPAEPLQVNVDDAQIAQVFSNLFTNAGQAMAGSGTLSIALGRQNGSVCITVSDNGPGIAPENISRLFEPLFSTKMFGVGLGLSVCRNFVESNGGSIEVQSTPGKGAAFTVRLPVVEPAGGN